MSKHYYAKGCIGLTSIQTKTKFPIEISNTIMIFPDPKYRYTNLTYIHFFKLRYIINCMLKCD